MPSRSGRSRGSGALRALSLLAPLLIAGCTAGPDYVRPPVPPVPEYRPDEVLAGESVANLPWWELFEDPVLQELIQAGLEENLSLRTSLARIDEARATLGIVRSDLFPRVDYSAPGTVGFTTEDGDATTSALAALNAS